MAREPSRSSRWIAKPASSSQRFGLHRDLRREVAIFSDVPQSSGRHSEAGDFATTWNDLT